MKSNLNLKKIVKHKKEKNTLNLGNIKRDTRSKSLNSVRSNVKEKFKFRIERFNYSQNNRFMQSFPLIKFSLKQLISANAHLGYEVNRWNPEMKSFLWGSRSNMHILNLQETSLIFRRVFAFTTTLIKLRKLLLFSSENKHIDHVLKKILLVENQSMSSNRWIGGIITNYKEIRKNIRFLTTRYNTKLKYKLLSNRRKKLKVALEGLFELYQIPSLVIILNGVKSRWAINEVLSKNLPCAAIIDSVSNSKLKVNFPIPGNVYGFATQVLYVKLFITLIKNARLYEILTFVQTRNISSFIRKRLISHRSI